VLFGNFNFSRVFYDPFAGPGPRVLFPVLPGILCRHDTLVRKYIKNKIKNYVTKKIGIAQNIKGFNLVYIL
jgi:hypothetical protein